MKKSDSIEPYTNLTKRLKSPSVQPILTKNLRPLSGPVVMQASLKYDGHRLIKPDFNPANTKPKIASLAVDTVPTIEIEDFNLDNFNKTREIDIFVTNPNYRATKFYLLPYNGKLEMENGERMRNELDFGQIFNCSCPGEEITLQGSVQGVAVDSEVVRVSEDVVCFGRGRGRVLKKVQQPNTSKRANKERSVSGSLNSGRTCFPENNGRLSKTFKNLQNLLKNVLNGNLKFQKLVFFIEFLANWHFGNLNFSVQWSCQVKIMVKVKLWQSLTSIKRAKASGLPRGGDPAGPRVRGPGRGGFSPRLLIFIGGTLSK